MNRDILFRGKRTDNGEWVEGAYLSIATQNEASIGIYIPNGAYWIWYEVNPSTVGQFTGLTDKDGKRIFEGDIVSIHWNGDEEDVECYEITDIRSLPKMCGSCIDWREVVGNIYDKAVSE